MNNRYANLGYLKNTANAGNIQSALYDPLQLLENNYGSLRTAERYQNRSISARTLRRIASKAWIISLCKLNIIRHIEPFLKPSTNKNLRGFVILKKGEDISNAYGKKSKEATAIENFLINTGFEEDDDREDTFIKYCTKILNDFFDIDQIATEIQYTAIGKPYAFWAIDAATIEKVLPGQVNPDKWKYIQVIDHLPYAAYKKNELIFDFQNARSELMYSFYGYSYVEQAIDLITGFINAFAYNSGFFTENKLPRGMLLIDGDVSQETMEAMIDYITEIMSGTVSNQYRIPILPSGFKRGEGGGIKWQQLGGSNRDMEFQGFLDLLISGVTALFGTSVDDIGLHSAKSQPMIDGDSKHKYQENKSRVLGNVLGYLQSYLNRIIAVVNPDYQLEFIGYEREDPKEIADLDKIELDTYKTLNEKREEKGLKALEYEWANIPMSPQVVQLYQSSQGGMSGMEDVGDDDLDGGEEDEETAWGEALNGGDEPEEPKVDFGEDIKETSDDVEKSLHGKNKTIRIVV